MSLMVDGEFFFRGEVMTFNNKRYVFHDGICWRDEILLRNTLIKQKTNYRVVELDELVKASELSQTLEQFHWGKDVLWTNDISQANERLAKEDLQNQFEYFRMLSLAANMKTLREGRIVKVVKSEQKDLLGKIGKLVGHGKPKQPNGEFSYWQVDLGSKEKQQFQILHPSQLEIDTPEQNITNYHCRLCSGNEHYSAKPCKIFLQPVCKVEDDGSYTKSFEEVPGIPVVCTVCWDRTNDFETLGDYEFFDQHVKLQKEKIGLWNLNKT